MTPSRWVQVVLRGLYVPVPEPEAKGVTTAVVSISGDDTPTERPTPC